jgi:hypothetical protein
MSRGGFAVERLPLMVPRAVGSAPCPCVRAGVGPAARVLIHGRRVAGRGAAGVELARRVFSPFATGVASMPEIVSYWVGPLRKITILPPGVSICCCGSPPTPGPCRIPPDIAESLTVTVTSDNAILQVTSAAMVWTAADGGKWTWEDERCCSDAESTSWCGYNLTLFCNSSDHPLHDPNFPDDAYLLLASSSMFDPAQNGGTVTVVSEPSSVQFSPLRLRGSFSAVLYNGDCGGASTASYSIDE